MTTTCAGEWYQEQGRILQPDGLPPSHYRTPSFQGVAFGETVELAHCREPFALSLTHFDPGNSAYRYHSAFNVGGGGRRSCFVRFGDTNRVCDLRQFDGDRDRDAVRRLAETAHVVHVHMDYETLMQSSQAWKLPSDPEDLLVHGLDYWPRSDQLLVRHYHGSHPNPDDPKAPPLVENREDDEYGAVQMGARLYHRRFSKRMSWLPIPVPVRDYEALVSNEAWAHRRGSAGDKGWRLRVAHSPTNPRIKGTFALQHAMLEVQARGIDVELVSIQGLGHAEALRLKATCDVCFDSFWLGIQGSGLEAAAMKQAVIAGDASVRDEYVASEVGECPYTFVETFEQLRDTIARMATDPEWRLGEARRVRRYVETFHDYPEVGARYWRIIAREARARGLPWAQPTEFEVTYAAL